jgi:hypothetical protein
MGVFYSGHFSNGGLHTPLSDRASGFIRGHGLVHGYHHAIGHVFFSDVSHTIFNAFVYSAVFRLTRKLPLTVLLVIVAVLIVLYYVRDNRSGRPWR